MSELLLPKNCLEDPIMAHLAGIIITSIMLYPSFSQKKERADMQTVMKAKKTHICVQAVENTDAEKKIATKDYLYTKLIGLFGLQQPLWEQLIDVPPYSMYMELLSTDQKTFKNQHTLYYILLLLLKL